MKATDSNWNLIEGISCFCCRSEKPYLAGQSTFPEGKLYLCIKVQNGKLCLTTIELYLKIKPFKQILLDFTRIFSLEKTK